MRLGFIGAGEITSSIVTGLRSSGAATHAIRLSPRNPTIASELARRFDAISVASTNQEVLDHSDTIVIAVRPLAAREVLSELRFHPDHRVISLVSALSLRSLSALVAPAARIARAVPLPSTAKRLSPTAVYPRDEVALELFAAIGTVFPVESENEFEAFCAATATIASYFAFNETIASWLERQGVPAPLAREYVARLFFGVTSGAMDAPAHSFKSLAATHATAGGINEQILERLVAQGLMTGVSEALDAVLYRIGTERQSRDRGRTV